MYSDRTEYSAYTERCRESMVIVNRKNGKADKVLTKVMIACMSFRDFAETVSHEWIKDNAQVKFSSLFYMTKIFLCKLSQYYLTHMFLYQIYLLIN